MIRVIRMATTKYQSVYKQEAKKGQKPFFYYSVYLGKDPLIKKGRRDRFGNHFKTARDAHLEVQRILNEYGTGSNMQTSSITWKNS